MRWYSHKTVDGEWCREKYPAFMEVNATFGKLTSGARNHTLK